MIAPRFAGRVAHSVKFVAQRKAARLDLRIVDPELAFEHLVVLVQPTQRIAQAIHADHRRVVDELAERALAHDVGEKAPPRGSRGAELAGLVREWRARFPKPATGR